jgi:hypothetical protein
MEEALPRETCADPSGLAPLSNLILFKVVAPLIAGSHINDCMSDTKRRKPEEFSDAIFIRCPPSLRAAIADAARQQLTSAANYTRSAVVAKLRAEGFYPVRHNETATSARSVG